MHISTQENETVRATKRSLRSRCPNSSMVIKTAVISEGADQTLGFSVLDNAAPVTYGLTQTRVHVIINNMEDNNIEPIGFLLSLVWI